RRLHGCRAGNLSSAGGPAYTGSNRGPVRIMRPIASQWNAHNVSTKIRPPAVAGLFYPADPTELRDVISEYSAQAATVAGPTPKALIVPHAGYIYSGVIAAAAYS